MRIIIHPVMDPQRETDVTQRLVAAIAEELCRTCGGNDHLDWIEIESLLRQIVDETTIEASLAETSLADLYRLADKREGPARRNASAPSPDHRRRISKRHWVASIHEEGSRRMDPIAICLEWIRHQLELVEPGSTSLAEFVWRQRCAIELFHDLNSKSQAEPAKSLRLGHQYNNASEMQALREINDAHEHQDGTSDHRHEEQWLSRDCDRSDGVGQRSQRSAREPRSSLRRRCSRTVVYCD